MTTKQEGNGNDKYKFPKAIVARGSGSGSGSSSREWSAFRNPRIVRVSRSFGGKDRHSKVCTVRGLRDRRIRLSVPTAIQLYDLQDRLGLSQPSKVIDWLLDATKLDIDKLPPLQLPQGFSFHQQFLLSNNNQNNTNHDPNQDQDSIAKFNKYWETETSLKNLTHQEKGKWIKENEELENNRSKDGGFNCNSSAQNLFPLTSNTSPLPNLLSSTNPMPYYHWDASNLSLSQFGPSNHGFLHQSSSEASLNTNSTNNNTVSLPSSSLAFSSNNTSSSSYHHQFFFCPTSAMPSLFPQYPPYSSIPLENNIESREINHLQLFTPSGSQHMGLPSSRSISMPMKNFSLNAHSHNAKNDDERQSIDCVICNDQMGEGE